MCDKDDFSAGAKNSYSKPQRTTVTMQLNTETVEYFKSMAKECNLPLYGLINAYLSDCAAKQRKPVLTWHKRYKRRKQRKIIN